MSKPRRGDEGSFDAFADDAEASVTTPVKSKQSAPAGDSVFADPLVRRLSWLGALMLVAFLATVASALFFGVLNPAAPRTALERELSVAQARVESENTTATPEDWFNYANALIAAKQYSKAERIINTARDGGMEDPTKQYLGVAQVRLDLAREEWETTLKDSEEAMKALEAQYEIEKERYETTHQPNTMVAEGLTGNYDILRLARAEAFEELKRYDEAIAELDGYLGNNERAADILVWRGDLKVKVGDDEGAIADYKNASTYMPGDQDLAKKLADLGASND